MKLRLEEFKNSHCNDYINLYEEFIKYNSDLVPDILEIKCRDEVEYNNLLKEIDNRENGKQTKIDKYIASN